MPDLHDFLDDEARRVRAKPGALGGVLDRANRRTRRIATTVLALVVAAAGVGLAYAAFRPAGQAEPRGLPIPGPTVSGTPGRVLITVINASATEGAAEFGTAVMAAHGVMVDVAEVPLRGDPQEVTRIHSHPAQEEQATLLSRRFFPYAELRLRAAPGVIEIRIGTDFIEANRDLFENFAVVRSFMTRRVEGDGAEAFLSDDAAVQFGDEPGGISLYRYAANGAFQIRSLTRPRDVTSVAEVVIVTPAGGDAVVVESLTVGRRDGQPMILAGELATPFDEVQVFVDSFLEARREASGAGTYLGEDAREAYASHENGLDLLGYAASADLRLARVVQYDKLSPDRHRVVVLFVLSRPAAGEFEPERIHEVLTIEPLDEGFVVADAERRFSG